MNRRKFLLGTTAFVVYLTLGLGQNYTNIPWQDQDSINGTIEIGYRHQFNDRLTGGVRWLHLSQPFVGSPFDNRKESFLDHYGAYLEIILF